MARIGKSTETESRLMATRRQGDEAMHDDFLMGTRFYCGVMKIFRN